MPSYILGDNERCLNAIANVKLLHKFVSAAIKKTNGSNKVAMVYAVTMLVG